MAAILDAVTKNTINIANDNIADNVAGINSICLVVFSVETELLLL